MMRGSTPVVAHPTIRPSGLGQHDGGSPIGDARRGTGRDDAGRAVDRFEDQREPLQAFNRDAGPRMFIDRELRGLPLGVEPRRRSDFVHELAGSDRFFGLVLAVAGKSIGLLSRDAVLPAQDFGRLAHDQVRQGVEEPVAVHRIDERKVAHLVAPPRVLAVEVVRHPAHRFHAAGQHQPRLADLNGLRTKRDRLEARGARLIDRLCRRRVRQARAAPTITTVGNGIDTTYNNLGPADGRAQIRSGSCSLLVVRC
jgi:hypothetical protein